jgi:hydrogenase maturation protease
MSKRCTDRVVVLGVGNELLKDEGFGVHVARELAGRTFASPVEIIEAGTVPDCWQGCEPISRLVVIDAVYGGSEPGAIYRFSPEDIEFETCLRTSIHQLSFVDSLKLSEITGNKPEKTVIIGVEPKEVAWGTELSEELRNRIPDVVKIVLKEITPDQGTG